MRKYVCIHGHFYQPPRENPWLEDVELQDSAYPYHDWNDKITEECYRQNGASRILASDKRIIDIVNNYSNISFDFGPTLLSWLERHAPDVYERVIDADVESQRLFSGHGAAIAQAYNHIIMPLANTNDKRTQIAWGINDFEFRFGRMPEGMWLPETAVDNETLDMMAESGIKFTILAPHQAKRIRRIGDSNWENVNKGAIDISRPYVYKLPSGRSINLFFYNAEMAQGVVSGQVLQDGEFFARKLMWILGDNNDAARLAHIATDGETYGHHYRYTDMALAYCLHYIRSNNLADITIYGEYLEKYPPEYEAEIYENSSWSCSHGVERWRMNCGCNYGRFPSGKQQWRRPLRDAMNWLRDRLIEVYEKKMTPFCDPWKTRNEYISVINNRSNQNVENFLKEAAGRELAFAEKVIMLKLLEMQRNALLMFTSCGWFFDDISGIEAVQIMNYASRAIQLAKEVGSDDFEPEFENILEKANTNVKEYSSGREVYDSLVKPVSIDLNRVGAHLAVSSIFEEYPDKIDIYCYSADVESYDRTDAGIQTLAIGRATIQSNIVLERHSVDFAVLHFGEHDLTCAVNAKMADDSFIAIHGSMKNAFNKGDIPEVMRLMNISFGGHNYSLWHLFKDQQRHILYELLETTWHQIEDSFRHIYEHNYTTMQVIRGMNMPLPKALSMPVEFIINNDLSREINEEESDLRKIKKLADEAARLSLQLDEPTLRFEAGRKINSLMNRFDVSRNNIEMLANIVANFKMLLNIVSGLDMQNAQNVFFRISRQSYPDMKKKVLAGDEQAKKWVDYFKSLAQHLDVKIE